MKNPVLLILISASLFSGAQTIPSSRTANWKHSGYDGTIPSPSVIVDVTSFGATGDGVTDNYNAILNAIASVNGAAVIYFPPGNYLIGTSLSLRDSIVLRGYSADSTHLLFNFNGATGNAITITGSAPGTFTSVTALEDRGSSRIIVADASDFSAGDFAELQETNGSWDTQPVSWADNSVGQILHITAVSGDTLFFDEALRINYLSSLNPVARRIIPRREAGIECLGISRQDSVHTGVCINIYFSYAANCWVKGVESSKSIGSHIEADASTSLSIFNCYIHDNFEYDGTSTHGYGITLFGHTVQCRVENNILRHVRHAFSLQCGSNGNVIAYNYSIDPNRSEFPANYGADISMHGHYTFSNLFEGNIVQNIQIDQTWGPTGPFNTFFRNRAELYGILMTSGTVQSDSLNFVGNEVTNTAILMGNYTLAGSGHFEFGNNIKGTITPAGTANLSDSSYYLDSLPVFWTSSLFPVIGPPNPIGAGTIAAKERYLSGINFATCELNINTGITENLKNEKLRIYPNPAKDFFSMNFISEKSGDGKIIITDISGRIIFSEKEIIRDGENNYRRSTINFKPGIYTVEFYTENNIRRTKLIIAD